MLKIAFCGVALVTGLACSGVGVEPTNTLVLVDSTGQTASFGAVQLTANATSQIVTTPGGTLNGVVLHLALTKNPPDSTTPMVACVDLRVYTAASGGSMIYSSNQSLGEPCHAASGFTSGASGVQQAFDVVTAVTWSELSGAAPVGRYYARFHVTFPDSSTGEVRAGTIALY